MKKAALAIALVVAVALIAACGTATEKSASESASETVTVTEMVSAAPTESVAQENARATAEDAARSTRQFAPVASGLWRFQAVHDLSVRNMFTRSQNPPSEAGFGSIKRRGWDSNPRDALRRPTVFKTAPFVRSGTPPTGRLAAYSTLEEEAEVRRALGQAAHEIRKPLRPERRGDE
jgi:hypothetical protein